MFPRFLAAALIPPVLAACGTTVVVESNPSLAKADEEASAKVYFLRRGTGSIGEQRHAFTIFLDGKPLLTLAEQEYTLLYLKPESGVMTVGSPPPGVEPSQDVFSFQPRNTYYVGFRRQYFAPNTSLVRPVLMSEEDAGIAVNDLKAVGLAQREPVAAVAVAMKPEPEGCHNWFKVGGTSRHSCLNLMWEVPALVVFFPIFVGAMFIGSLE